MIELIGGIVIGGVAGVALKDKIVGILHRMILSKESQKHFMLKMKNSDQRSKEAERQVEDLMAELEESEKRQKRTTKNKEELRRRTR